MLDYGDFVIRSLVVYEVLGYRLVCIVCCRLCFYLDVVLVGDVRELLGQDRRKVVVVVVVFEGLCQFSQDGVS